MKDHGYEECLLVVLESNSVGFNFNYNMDVDK